MAGTKMQNSNFTTMLHREKWLLSPRLRQVSFLLPHSGRKSISCRKKNFYYEADFFRSISSIVLPPYFSCYLENACSLRDREQKKNSDPKDDIFPGATRSAENDPGLTKSQAVNPGQTIA